MNKMYGKYKKQGLFMIGLSVDRRVEDARNFVAAAGTRYPVFMADDNIMDAYDLRFVPYHIYIDRKGRVRAREVGFNADKKSEIEEKIVELLGEGSLEE